MELDQGQCEGFCSMCDRQVRDDCILDGFTEEYTRKKVDDAMDNFLERIIREEHGEQL